MRQRSQMLVLALTLLTGACGPGAESGDPGLRGFQGCGDLQDYLEAESAREMNERIDAILAGLVNGTGPGDAGFASRSAATSFTTTNTQERGVDEPDYVKNDGARIFVLHGQHLLALQAWPPENLSLQSSTRIEGYPQSMLLDGRLVVVFSSIPGPLPYPFLRTPIQAVANHERTKISVFDTASGKPEPLHELYIDEGYRSARKTDRYVRLVTSAFGLGPSLRYWLDTPVDWTDPEAVRAAYEALRAENLKTIQAATLADWLPEIQERRSGSVLETVTRECSAIHASGAPAEFGITTVTTLDLNGLGRLSRFTSLLNPNDETYASRDALFLTAHERYQYGRPTGPAQPERTYLHEFDFAAGRVRYAGSGSVPGRVADQFSLDEEGGYLRVATTQNAFSGDPAQPATNNVFVLRADRGRLTTAGALMGLAPGETLYSARFEGSRGYLVTFRQIDPLFTLDLRQPAAPRVAGELKVPGFSTYLHALDPGHLLTIGREISDDGRRPGGLQLQIFDVANLAQPTQTHQLSLGSSSSNSDAAYDHAAFNYFAARGLLAIPFSDWGPGGTAFTSSIQLLRVSTDRGIEPIGSVDHGDLIEPGSFPGWTPYMRRSVMLDDYVYSISWSGVKVNDVRALDRTIASVRLPQPWGN